MLNKKAPSLFSGEFLIITAAALWGIISLFSRPLNEFGFSSAEITFVRSVLSVVFLGIYLLFRNKNYFKISLKDLPLLLFLGIGCFMAVCLLYTLSIEENGSSLAAMLEYTAPIWTVLLSRFIFKEKISVKKIIALVGVLGGCAMLSFDGEVRLSIKGLIFGVGTGIALSLYKIMSKTATKKYPAESITFYMFLFSALGMFFIATSWNIPIKIYKQPQSIYYFLALAFLSTALAYILFAFGVKTVSAGKASMFSTVEILTAAVVGIIAFNERLGFLGYIGIVVTVLSLLFLQLSDKKIKKIKRRKEYEKI